jgi:hypothetical protein
MEKTPSFRIDDLDLIRLEKLTELSRFSVNCQSETNAVRRDYPPIPAIPDGLPL